MEKGGKMEVGRGEVRERDGERKRYPGFSLCLLFGLPSVSPLAEASGKSEVKGTWEMPRTGSTCRVER